MNEATPYDPNGIGHRAGRTSVEHSSGLSRDFLSRSVRFAPEISRSVPCAQLAGDAKGFDLFEKPGAGDRDRTDDIQLGKLSFYH